MFWYVIAFIFFSLSACYLYIGLQLVYEMVQETFILKNSNWLMWL